MKLLIKNIALLMITGIISSTVIAGEIYQIKDSGQSLITSVIDRTITYQGILKNSSGIPVPNSTYNLTFRIYNQSSGGSALWTSVAIPVMTSGGLFSTLLGPISLPFDTTYYISIQVAGDAEMSRQAMTMSPYSACADTANYAKAAISDSKWSFRITDTADTTLTTGGQWGITRSGNVLWGNADSTHVNLGVQCTTGISGENYKYCTIGGGYLNTAVGLGATISGGETNTTYNDYTSIGGGNINIADGLCATVGGGFSNTASGGFATIGGGSSNTASGGFATIGGGSSNTASDGFAAIGGGSANTASGYYATVGGGYNNTASDNRATVSGGYNNTATDDYATVSGGYGNTASGYYATVGGGQSDTAKAVYGGVSSGRSNLAGDASTDTAAFVGGGWNNSSNGKFSAIAGGGNNFSDNYCFIGGGTDNTASNSYALVGGGYSNTASGSYSTISGGVGNTASGNTATIGGGWDNICDGPYSCIPGGASDTIATSGNYSFAYGYGIYCNDNYRTTFYDGLNSGSFNINRDQRDGYNTFPLQIGTSGSNGNGALLTHAGVWTNSSSRTFKENFTPFDGTELLRKISALSVTTYNYKNSTEKHIGPVAEEFVGAFDTGVIRESDGKREDMYLAASDVAGVALAGVQELLKKIEQLENKNSELERRIVELESK